MLLLRRLAACIVLGTITANPVDDTCGTNYVSYGELGCFSMDPPWKSIPRPLPAPQSPDFVDTKFYLHTRNMTDSFLVVKLPAINLEGSSFVGSKPTFFLTHGFHVHGTVVWLDEIKDALLQRIDANVFTVHWEKGASKLNYLEVAANTRIVGAETARLATYLLKYEGADTSRFHLIGHSLGAHIMAYVAKRIPNIARLTALDPAQPAFEGYPSLVRLDKADALFVEVIHTNAKPFIPFLGAGMMGETGDVDFYINGGWDQPGCLIPKNIPNVTSMSELALLPVEVLATVVKCPHERSILIFKASILNEKCKFWGSRASPLSITASILSGGNFPWLMFKSSCSQNSCTPLGLETINYPARGSFLLATTWSEPFCIPEPTTDIQMEVYRTQNDIVASEEPESELKPEPELESKPELTTVDNVVDGYDERNYEKLQS